jgi:hypothetical protein
VQVQAFFNFLAPKPGAAAGPNPKARELAEELLEVVSQVKPGSAVSPVLKAEVEELVSECGGAWCWWLARCMRTHQCAVVCLGDAVGRPHAFG